jgi:hypothetical protein
MINPSTTPVKAHRFPTGVRGAQVRFALALALASTMGAGRVAYGETSSVPSAVPTPPSVAASPSESPVPVTVVLPQVEPTVIEAPHGSTFNAFPSHHFQWAAQDNRTPQVAVNFGLLQLALGGFNIAGEVRYRRLWLEYSHGVDLTLNNVGGFGLSATESKQNLHLYVPYTTGFGVGVTLLDELWLGVEFKDHKYEVNAPGGPTVSYNTYSIGPVVGYKLFILRGLFLNAYLRYWPTVATTLEGNKVTLQGSGGPVVHEAHDWGLFANLALGYAFDL